MNETEKLAALRLELHAAIAMNALVVASSGLACRDVSEGDQLLRVQQIEHLVERAFQIAHAVIAKAGPIE